MREYKCIFCAYVPPYNLQNLQNIQYTNNYQQLMMSAFRLQV